MAETNNGSVESRLKEISKKIDAYYDSISMKIIPNEGIETYLQMNQTALRSLSATECGEISFILSQYALFLQKQYNFQKMQHDWASSSLHYLAAQEGKNYGKYTKYEEKVAAFSAENSYGMKLNSVMVETREYMNSLEFMATRVNQMATCLIELQQSKRREK